jgi:hypothetical protein
MCIKGHDLKDIQSADLDDTEREWLLLVRLQCMSYEHNHAEGWDRAIDHAEAHYGADEGPGIASRIAVLIRAMRAERRGGFGYLSPYCPNCRLNITDDEQQLITLMRAGYRGIASDVEAAAAEFARRPEAPVLAAAATRFGTAIAAAMKPRRPRAVPTATTLH